MTPIEHMQETLALLLDALDTGEQSKVEHAQKQFIQAVQEAWEKYERGEIAVTMRGLPRAMYMWVTNELSQMIQTSEQWPTAKRELWRFKRLLDTLLDSRPGEQAR